MVSVKRKEIHPLNFMLGIRISSKKRQKKRQACMLCRYALASVCVSSISSKYLIAPCCLLIIDLQIPMMYFLAKSFSTFFRQENIAVYIRANSTHLPISLSCIHLSIYLVQCIIFLPFIRFAIVFPVIE